MPTLPSGGIIGLSLYYIKELTIGLLTEATLLILV